MVTNETSLVIEEVLNSFKRQHNAENGELSVYTKELISSVAKPYNRTQRQDMYRSLFTIGELD